MIICLHIPGKFSWIIYHYITNKKYVLINSLIIEYTFGWYIQDIIWYKNKKMIHLGHHGPGDRSTMMAALYYYYYLVTWIITRWDLRSTVLIRFRWLVKTLSLSRLLLSGFIGIHGFDRHSNTRNKNKKKPENWQTIEMKILFYYWNLD